MDIVETNGTADIAPRVAPERALNADSNVVYVHTQATFSVVALPECKVCKKPVKDFFEGPCGHLMHETCVNNPCTLCEPTVDDKVFGMVLYALGGTMGLSDLLTRDYYMAVLHSLCPGYFFFFRLLVVGVKNKILRCGGRIHTEWDEIIFLGACLTAYESPEVAIPAMWVTGFYYMPIDFYKGPYAKIIEAVLSMSLMYAGMLAVHQNEAMGVLVISAVSWRYLWTWPRLWDLHPGNCFGLLGIALYVAVCLGLGVLVHQTFHNMVVGQVYLLSQVFFSQRSMRHYFRAKEASMIVFIALQVLISTVVHKLNYYEARLRSQK